MPATSLGRRNETCAASGERFVPDEPIVACLLEPEPGEPGVRLDYRERAWDNGARPEDGIVLGWWRTMARVSALEPEPTLSKEDLIELALRGSGGGDGEASAEEADPKQAAVRYFLALELVRRRALELLHTDREAVLVREVLTVKQREERGGDAEAVTVPASGFSPSELEETARLLGPLVGLDDD